MAQPDTPNKEQVAPNNKSEIAACKTLLPDSNDDQEDYIDGSRWIWERDGLFVFEEDVKIGGNRWRIHLKDADASPSNPHAHCISGGEEGKKIDLREGYLYDGTRNTGKKLCKRDFERLLAYARQKHPNISFPLQN